ncbi:MAG: hypothetical protein ACLQFR_29655 [Streptosporangiaceae bacterium]
MNYVVCPYDETRRKARQRPADGRPLVMSCPARGKHFGLGPGGPVEVPPDDGNAVGQ